MSLDGGPPLRDLLVAFSPQGDALAVSSGDGRIKTWDVASGRLRAEFTSFSSGGEGGSSEVNGHLALQYTSLSWGHGPPQRKKSKKDSSKKEKPSTGLLAAGSSSGQILAWDTALGELRWRTEGCHSGSAASLAYAPSGSTLYSGGSDGQICETDATTGNSLGKFKAGRQGISCVAVSPDGSHLLAAGTGIRLFDLSSKKRVKKYPGHANPISVLTFTLDNSHFLSAALGERQLALWSVDSDTAVANFSVEDPPVSVSCSSSEEGEEVVVAVTEIGEVWVWKGESFEQAAKCQPTRIRVSNARTPGKKYRASSGEIVLAAHPLSEESILVARGTLAKPKFEKVRLKEDETLILLEPEEEGLLLGKQKSKTKSTEGKKGAVTVLGPESGVENLDPRFLAAAAQDGKKRKKKEKVDEKEEKDDDPQASGRPEADGLENGEPTLGEKIEALGLLEKSGELSKNQIPSAGSLQVLLSQGLQSDDKDLLERCLACTDEKVIVSTVRRLQPSDAIKFLGCIIARLQTRPSRGVLLVPWIQALLLNHAGLLMSAPGAQKNLAALSNVIEARLANFRALLALQGRLELLVGQLGSAGERQANPGTGEDLPETAAVYEGSEDEIEDVMEVESGSEDEEAQGGGSGGEWETDNDVDDAEFSDGDL